MIFHVLPPLQNRQKQSKLMIFYIVHFLQNSQIQSKVTNSHRLLIFKKNENHFNFMFFSPKTIFDACKVFSFPNISLHNRFRFQIQSSAYASRHLLPILGRRSINLDILFFEGSHAYFIRLLEFIRYPMHNLIEILAPLKFAGIRHGRNFLERRTDLTSPGCTCAKNFVSAIYLFLVILRRMQHMKNHQF